MIGAASIAAEFGAGAGRGESDDRGVDGTRAGDEEQPA